MTSSKANRYGSRGEAKLAERYNVRRVDEYWRDGVGRTTGTPWEFKVAMATRSNGSEGKIRVFEDAHDKLASAGGRYGVASYRRCGSGIMILQMTSFPASELPLSRWYSAGGHRDSRQTKIPLSRIF